MKTEQAKTYHLGIADEGFPVLVISEKKGIRNPRMVHTVYRVEVNPNAPKSYRLHKLVHLDETPTTYDVKLSGRYPSCTCPWGLKDTIKPCRHLEALMALDEAGRLKEVMEQQNGTDDAD